MAKFPKITTPAVIRMKARLLALTILLPSTAFGASLPLIDGEYTRGKCQGRPDILESMGIYTVDAGPDKGHQILMPDGEDGGGESCVVGKVTSSDNTFSGTTKCAAGSRHFDAGTYRFSYKVLNNQTFISKGKQYVWCSKGM
jgi:hypothetical protein